MAQAEPSHFTLELLEPKLTNEPGRATEKPARAEPKRAEPWLDPPLHLSTDGCNILNTPIKKHFIDLLERLRSERYKDEVSCFYVGDVF